MTNKIIDIIKKTYPLRKIDVGDMKTVKANGMTFEIEAFYAEGLGHISVMKAKGFFGLMKMDTLIVNPFEIDLPLYSYDRIYAMGNDTLIVELYNTFIKKCRLDKLKKAKAEFNDLPEHELGAHWYDSIKLAESISKKGKKSESKRFDELTLKHFEAFLALKANDTNSAEKKEKAGVYVDGLLKNGGPSTDVFKKALGEEKTSFLFKTILFGTV